MKQKLEETEYEIDYKKLREGIEELVKLRVNQILERNGNYTLRVAMTNYRLVRILATRFGVDFTKYDSKINEFTGSHGLTGYLGI